MEFIYYVLVQIYRLWLQDIQPVALNTRSAVLKTQPGITNIALFVPRTSVSLPDFILRVKATDTTESLYDGWQQDTRTSLACNDA